MRQMDNTKVQCISPEYGLGSRIMSEEQLDQWCTASDQIIANTLVSRTTKMLVDNKLKRRLKEPDRLYNNE